MALPRLSRKMLIFLAALKWLLMCLYLSSHRTQDSTTETVPATARCDSSNNSVAETVIMCGVYQQVNGDDVNRIYFVTPTYPRPVQLADLTRLGQTLMHVPNLHWIVVEDTSSCSPVVSDLLQRLGMSYTHMASPMPAAYRRRQYLPRGVSARRAALKWLRQTNASRTESAVVYFGDDDNAYDLRLFDEIRDTRGVSMFPVGLIGDWLVSSPVIRDGRVIGFYDSWPVDRVYPVDMAGFAVNIQLLYRYPAANFIYVAGYEEDRFLRSLQLKAADIEVKAANCTQIYVWHTRTAKVQRPSLRPPSVKGTSLETLLGRMDSLGIISLSGEGTKTKMAVPKSVKASWSLL